MTDDGNQLGRRLVQTVIDERARDGWHCPYACIPTSQDPREGFRDVSYAVFANGINRTAAWLRDHVGTSETFETIAYIGPNDFRYQLFTMAAAKVGYVMLLISPRNNSEAFQSMFEEVNVETLVSASQQLLPALSRAVRSSSVTHLVCPSTEDLLDESPVEHVGTLSQDFDDLRMKPWLRMHTSGSTGLPKVVTLKHGFPTSLDAFKRLEVDELTLRYGGKRILVSSPLFHVAGCIASMPSAIWYGCTVVLPPPAPLTADLVIQTIINAGVEFAMLPPSIVTDIAKSEPHLKVMGTLKGCSFAGGPLAAETAEKVAEHTAIFSSIGATEWAVLPMKPKERGDWNYFHFNQDIGGIEFRPTESPGVFELVIVRDKSLDLVQAVFTTFPDIDEYPTKDLFAPHPTKRGHWKYVARRDDVIVFSNGEKLNPVGMEGAITTCPQVSGCLVVGQGRFQCALIVEPKDHEMKKQDLLEQVWPYVEKANLEAPQHGRISRGMIISTQPDKPLSRAGKGTVQRAPNNRLFEAEVNELYLQQANASKDQAREGTKVDLSSIDATRTSLRKLFTDSIGSKEFGDNDDLFSYGLDSLQLIAVVRAINAAKSEGAITAQHVYDNPTINRLNAVLKSGRPPKEYSDYDSDDEDDKQVWYSMESLFDKHSESLPRDPSRQANPLKGALKSSNHAPISQPDGGRVAWLQVLGSLLININNWGLINSYGVFQAYYQSAFLSDHSASEIAWIGSVQGALLLIVGVLSGPLFDKGYFRVLLVVAGLGLVFAMMMVSISTQYYQFMLAQGVLAGICSGLLYIPSIAVIPLYFKKRRGLALGVATAGGSLGGIIYPLVFRALLNAAGFGWAVRTVAFLILVTIGVATLIIHPIGPRSPRQLIDPSAFRDLPTLAFMAQALLLFAGVLVPYFLCTSFAIDRLRASVDLGFNLLAVLNAAQLLGRVVPCLVADVLGGGAEAMLFGAIAAVAVLGFSWIAVHGTAGYVVWLLAFGFASGVCATMPALVLPYLCPSLGVIGTRLGMVYACAGVGFLISAPVAGAADRSTGAGVGKGEGEGVSSFLGAQLWIGATAVGAMGFAAYTCLEARKWRKLVEGGRRSKKRGWAWYTGRDSKV